MAKQSGKSDGSVRFAVGDPRRVLYMASLANSKESSDPQFLKIIQEVSLIACMRKLLLMIHDMVRNQQPWDH